MFFEITPCGDHTTFLCHATIDEDRSVELLDEHGCTLEIEIGLFHRMRPQFVYGDDFDEAHATLRGRKTRHESNTLQTTRRPSRLRDVAEWHRA